MGKFHKKFYHFPTDYSLSINFIGNVIIFNEFTFGDFWNPSLPLSRSLMHLASLTVTCTHSTTHIVWSLGIRYVRALTSWRGCDGVCNDNHCSTAAPRSATEAWKTCPRAAWRWWSSCYGSVMVVDLMCGSVTVLELARGSVIMGVKDFNNHQMCVCYGFQIFCVDVVDAVVIGVFCFKFKFGI